MSPDQILEQAVEEHEPVAIYACFSGGPDSMAVVNYTLKKYPHAKVFMANTEIGIEATRTFARAVCHHYNWHLREIWAKRDCGEDYDELVRAWGFPGPDHHQKMYDRLKGRAVSKLVRESKKKRMDRVLLVSGIRHDESIIRMGYSGREINRDGAQVWANAIYWWDRKERDRYLSNNDLPLNPVSKQLGMSGECGCGAYAQPGELKCWRAIDQVFGARIDRLSLEAVERGFTWGWEGHPPKGGHNQNQGRLDPQIINAPLCGAGCLRSPLVRAELETA